MPRKGGAILDHAPPREQRMVAAEKQTTSGRADQTIRAQCVFAAPGEVYRVEVHAWVRRAAQVDGMSIREAARESGQPRQTVRKMLTCPEPRAIRGRRRWRGRNQRVCGGWTGGGLVGSGWPGLTSAMHRNNIVITMRTIHVSIRKIGNSQGVVIPKPVLAQVGLDSQVGAEMTIEDGALVLRRPAGPARAGWAEAARRIAEAGDDELVMGEFGNADDAELVW